MPFGRVVKKPETQERFEKDQRIEGAGKAEQLSGGIGHIRIEIDGDIAGFLRRFRFHAVAASLGNIKDAAFLQRQYLARHFIPASAGNFIHKAVGKPIFIGRGSR